jgi:hypothetical protein
MAAPTPGSSALEPRGVCKRHRTGQGGQVTAALGLPDNGIIQLESAIIAAIELR